MQRSQEKETAGWDRRKGIREERKEGQRGKRERWSLRSEIKDVYRSQEERYRTGQVRAKRKKRGMESMKRNNNKRT